MTGISPSKEKHLRGTNSKDKLGRRSMAGLEQPDHFKPLLKTTVIGLRGSSVSLHGAVLRALELTPMLGTKLPLGTAPRPWQEWLPCQPGTGPSRALSYRLYFAPLALGRCNPIPCPLSCSGSSPRPCPEVLLPFDPQRPRGKELTERRVFVAEFPLPAHTPQSTRPHSC